jgi:hypothetical protein
LSGSTRPRKIEPSRFVINVIVTCEPAGPSGFFAKQAPDWRRSSMSVLAGAASWAMQIGAGAGYYTAILAELVGPKGRVVAYEIEQDIAQRAAANLARYPQVEVRARSGVEDLPSADAIYVNAAASHPLRAWLDALKPGGRLLFPLQPARSAHVDKHDDKIALDSRIGGSCSMDVERRRVRGQHWHECDVAGRAKLTSEPDPLACVHSLEHRLLGDAWRG